MSKYERLTSDTGFARNLPINEELYDRLYYVLSPRYCKAFSPIKKKRRSMKNAD